MRDEGRSARRRHDAVGYPLRWNISSKHSVVVLRIQNEYEYSHHRRDAACMLPDHTRAVYK